MCEIIQLKKTAPGLYRFHPELGETCPPCEMSASIAVYGGGWYVDTDLDLKGRGIHFDGVLDSGKKCYKVTKLAFEKLKSQYAIAFECFLD